MKIYALTEKQIERLIEIGMDAHNDPEFAYTRLTPHDILNRCNDIKLLPVEFNEVTIKSLEVSCRYYPANLIIGFTQDNGTLIGVFIKSE